MTGWQVLIKQSGKLKLNMTIAEQHTCTNTHGNESDSRG